MNSTSKTLRGSHPTRAGKIKHKAGAVGLILVLLAALLAVQPTTAGAQVPPCQGGPGECIGKRTYVAVFQFTGTGTCEYTININWGDGNLETVVFQIGGSGERSVNHRYAGPGVYNVSFDGTGRIINATSCTYTDSTLVVQVIPASRFCLNREVTIAGTAGPDTLTGTPGDDVIIGRGGADTIRGGGGSDRICGGGGRDLLIGGAGVDGIVGGKGNDTIRGGPGFDVLSGSGGNDRIFGQGGPDILFGDAGSDVLDGGAGNDTIEGNGGNDQLRGRRGGDTLNGGVGTDSCNGGPGRNTIRNCE